MTAEKPWGYYCLNTTTGRHFTMTVNALKTIKDPNELATWEKVNKKLYPIDDEGRRLKTLEEIGTEQKQLEEIKKESKKK